MFTVYEQSADFTNLNQRGLELIQSIRQELFSGLAGRFSNNSFREGEIINCKEQGKSFVHFIEQGFVRVLLVGRALYYLEPGELIWQLDAGAATREFFCPEKVQTRRIESDQLFHYLYSSKPLASAWSEYLLIRQSLADQIIARSAPEADLPLPVIRSYDPGEPILIQETSADEVFTLLHGQADVWVNDVKVGEVLKGEIFGALAATTHTRRSASIIAQTFCVAAVLPQSEYLELIQTHPQTVNELMASMARIIVSQNEKILKLSE